MLYLSVCVERQLPVDFGGEQVLSKPLCCCGAVHIFIVFSLCCCFTVCCGSGMNISEVCTVFHLFLHLGCKQSWTLPQVQYSSVGKTSHTRTQTQAEFRPIATHFLQLPGCLSSRWFSGKQRCKKIIIARICAATVGRELFSSSQTLLCQ